MEGLWRGASTLGISLLGSHRRHGFSNGPTIQILRYWSERGVALKLHLKIMLGEDLLVDESPSPSCMRGELGGGRRRIKCRADQTIMSKGYPSVLSSGEV